jgi:hypothetical protein
MAGPLALPLQDQRREGPAGGVGLLLQRVDGPVAPQVLLPRNPRNNVRHTSIAGLARVHQLST